MRTRAVLLTLAVSAISCSDATSPSATTPPLGVGTFQLALIGDSFRCNDLKLPQAGTNVNVSLTATQDTQGAWKAAPATAADGLFQLSLTRSTGTATALSGRAGPFDVVVSGTWSGTMVDSGFLQFQQPNGTSVFLGAAAPVSGIVLSSPGTFANGLIMSEVTFTRGGVSSTCQPGAVSWTLNGPLSPKP